MMTLRHCTSFLFWNIPVLSLYMIPCVCVVPQLKTGTNARLLIVVYTALQMTSVFDGAVRINTILTT